MESNSLKALPVSTDGRQDQPESLIDRYKPAAVLALTSKQSFHLAQFSESFRELLIDALPGFIGDLADALALISEDQLITAAQAVEPITPAEIEHEYPVLTQLGKTLDLSFDDKLVLVFLLEAHGRWFWEAWVKELGASSKRDCAAALARTLAMDCAVILKIMQPDSPLRSSAIVKSWPIKRSADLFTWLEPHGDLDPSMLRSADAWRVFVDAQFSPMEQERLNHDFSYVEKDLELILSFLESALDANAKGVHVLVYGPPGTGKTTLARTIAQRLGAELIEIRKQLEMGPQTDGEARLRSFNLCQKLAGGHRRSVLLFDEIEDLLPAPAVGQQPRRIHKGSICESLEVAAHPTIWTGNSIRGIDPAILRRFTFTLELDAPPRKFREQMLNKLLPSVGLSTEWLTRIASSKYLTPAMINQLAEMASALHLRGDEMEDALERWLNARLKAVRKAPLPRESGNSQFRCDLLNTDIDPDHLIEGLKRSGEGRICLHGPPGTGKTAFAKHIAERLSFTAVVRRGSDLRSMWVGETERNVAAMFAEANRTDAVLILDEADSFLSHRARRRQGWEVNECSEFLVQLEAFQGIFCATTNRFEELDPAFIRRFDMKIELDFLTAEQRILALRHALREAGCSPRVSKKSEIRLQKLDQLTPSDIVSATRKLRLLDERVSQDRLVSALIHEVACKNFYKSRPIGFR